jgi:hypothetical protein
VLKEGENQEAEVSITASDITRRSIMVAALGAALWLLLATVGCASVQRDERPIRLVLKAPEGAAVTVQAAGSPDAKPLGAGPEIRLEKLRIVRKIFPNGAIDYWLKDGKGELPANAAKPAYASPDYSAGNDYPLELSFAASLSGFDTALASLTFGREELEQLFADSVNAPARIEIALAPKASPAPPPEEPKQLTPVPAVPLPLPEIPTTLLPSVLPASSKKIETP